MRSERQSVHNRGHAWQLVGAALLSFSATLAGADGASLSVKPDKCVALNKGQQCYQTIRFTWSTPPTGHFCLFEKGQQRALVCWQSQGAPPLIYEFVSSETRIFLLRDEGSETVLDQAQVSVAWVYKSNNKPSAGWRLF